MYDIYNVVFHLFLLNLANSDDGKYKKLVKKVIKKFSYFVKNFDMNKEDEDEDEIEVEKKKAWLCAHFDRDHYSRGKCRSCYLRAFHRV